MCVRWFLILTFLFCLTQSCYWNSKCPYVYFGSKTVYDDVRGDIRDAPKLTDCEPIGVWALIRHGIRHPSMHTVQVMKDTARFKDEIIRANQNGQGHLCAQDITNLNTWYWDDTLESTPNHLTTEGYQEMYNLGYRFHQNFSPLLQNLGQYYFKPTLEQRTTESARAFVDGLSQGPLKFQKSDATDRDDILRPYYYCNKHTNDVFNGPRSTNEINNYFKKPELTTFYKVLAGRFRRKIDTPEFKRFWKHPTIYTPVKHYYRNSRYQSLYYYKTEEFRNLLQNLQLRAGLPDPVTPTNATGLYDLCRYLRAYSITKQSPWCALFTDDELVIMEYLDDIRHYYRTGYGASINAKLGRPAVKDLFETFRGIAFDSPKSFTGYFTHDSLLQMVYAAMGLYKDYPVISGFKREPNRKWRTSFITPFAANFVAILHKCQRKDMENYQVQFFINEHEIHICSERTCSWNDFSEKFETFDSNLDFCNETKVETLRS